MAEKQMTKREAIEKASKKFKLAKLRGVQRAYGADVMDDVAIALNAVPTYEETKTTEFWFDLFQEMGLIPKEIK